MLWFITEYPDKSAEFVISCFKFYGIFKENSAKNLADLSGYSVMNHNITLVKQTLLYFRKVNSLKY